MRDLPVGATVVRVHEGAAAEGADGSDEHPYATLEAALRRQSGPRVVLLDAGTYAGPLVITHPTYVFGACAGSTVVTGVSTAPVVTARASVTLRDVTLQGGATGLSVEAQTGATLRDVVIRDALGSGVSAQGTNAIVDADGLYVHDLTATSTEGAIAASSRATVSLSRAVLASSSAHGVRAEGTGVSVTLRDVVVRDLSPSSRCGAIGVHARDRAQVTGERVFVERTGESGVFATGGARVTLTDATVRATSGFSNHTEGHGLVTNGAGHIECTRCLVEDVRQGGAVADGAGCEVALHASVVRRVATVGDGTQGTGLGANRGGHASADHTIIEAAHDHGVLGYGADAGVELSSCDVRGTLPRADQTQGVGVVAHTGAHVTLRDTLVRDQRNVGAIAYGPGATLELHGVTIADTAQPLDGQPGASLAAHTGAAVVGDHVALSNDLDAAIESYGAGATVTLEDLLVRPLGARRMPGGLGVFAAADGAVTLTRVAVIDVDGAAFASVMAEGHPGATTLSARDVFLDGVGARVFGGEVPFAYDLSVEGATMSLTRAVVLGGEYGFAVREGVLTLDEAVLRGATLADGVVNASPEVSLGTVSTQGQSPRVRRDVSVESARLQPPSAPSS